MSDIPYINKRASEYVRDFAKQQKKLGQETESISVDEAKKMGEKNIFELMRDFYQYPIIPIYDL